MMIQGMANQAMGHHTLPSPSSSGSGISPGFVFLQQPGIHTGHHQAGGRDISPGSTPGLHQPAPAATPPALVDDRNWLQQQHQQQHPQQQNMFFGQPRHVMNMQDKMSLEEQIKTQDLFPVDSGYRPPQQHQEQQHILNQMQLNEIALARSLNQYPYAPAQSPPTMFQQPQMHQHQPMPPRPRPEGGQDSSPNFLNEELNFKNTNSKKEDLVIDSWTGNLAAEDPPEKNTQQFYGGNGSNNLRLAEDKEPTGWGAPPPSNPNGWGQPPPKIGNWQQPPPPQGEIELYFFHIDKV